MPDRLDVDEAELHAIECDALAPEREENEIDMPYYIDLAGVGPVEVGDAGDRPSDEARGGRSDGFFRVWR